MPAKRKNRNAAILLVKALAEQGIVLIPGCTDEGKIVLYVNVNTHYMDWEIEPDARSYSVYIRERGTSRTTKEWYWEKITLPILKADWIQPYLEFFKKS